MLRRDPGNPPGFIVHPSTIPPLMFNLKSKMFAGLAALVCATAALAQDSGPLIDLLVKKGIINDQEGEDLRAWSGAA